MIIASVSFVIYFSTRIQIPHYGLLVHIILSCLHVHVCIKCNILSLSNDTVSHLGLNSILRVAHTSLASYARSGEISPIRTVLAALIELKLNFLGQKCFYLR